MNTPGWNVDLQAISDSEILRLWGVWCEEWDSAKELARTASEYDPASDDFERIFENAAQAKTDLEREAVRRGLRLPDDEDDCA